MMELSCSCDFDDFEDWFEMRDSDFTPMPQFSRRKRCTSCKKLINTGDLMLSFEHKRCAKTHVEERIFGDEVPLAHIYFCESCGEIYLNLESAGLCFPMGDMREALQAYWRMTGFNPEKYKQVA